MPRVAAVAPHELDRRAVDRDEQRPVLVAQRSQTAARAAPEHVGEVDARRVHAGLREQRRRATARTRTRAARSRRPTSPKRARWAATPVSTWSRTPASVASSGSIAWVAARRPRGVRRKRAEQVAADRLEAVRRARVVARPRARARRRARAPRPRGSPRCRARGSRARISRRNARKRSPIPGAASWSQSTGVSDSVSRRVGRGEHVEQRQVAGRHRLPQPLLAERPACRSPRRRACASAGRSRARRDRRPLGRAAHGLHTARKSSAPSSAAGSSRCRPQREVRLADRRREAVVERLADPQRRVHVRPSRALSASACRRSLRAW